MKNIGMEDTLSKVTRVISHRVALEVIFRGNSQARTNGKRLILPAPPTPCPEELSRVFHGLADHEVGHVLFSDFSHVVPFKKQWGERAYTVFNLIEDIRIERLMEQRYPGTRDNLAAAYKDINAKWQRDMDRIPLWSRTMGSLFHRGKGWSDEMYGSDAIQLVDLVADLVVQSSTLPDTRVASDLAGKILTRWQDLAGFGPDEVKRRRLKKDTPEQIQRLLESDGQGGFSLRDGLREMIEDLPSPAESGSYRVYSRDEDIVEVPNGGDPATFQHDLERFGALISGLRQKLLLTLKGQSQRRIVPDENGTGLNRKRLHQVLMPIPRIPRVNKAESPSNDVAVSILIDLSGSMKGSRIKSARIASVLLSETLDKLGYPFEVLGYTTARDRLHLKRLRDRDGIDVEQAEAEFTRTVPLKHLIFKGFGERLSKCRGRYDLMVPSCWTPTNESVLFAAQRLMKTQASLRILFVLTDGEVFIGNRSQRHIVIQNLKDNLDLIEKAGIECIGVGIQSEFVYETFEIAIQVDDLREFPQKLYAILSERLLRKRNGGKR